jgi:NAD(P)-dependent dehydrogenase (short-subunit alcohol dehydrogenase family)
MNALAGHYALITGGGSGIGLACAAHLLRDGATVTLLGRDPERLADGKAQLQSLGDFADDRIRTFAGDTAEEAVMAEAVAAAEGPGGILHIAVASAGVGGLAPLTHQSLEDFERVMRTNLTGTFLLLKHAGKRIAASGGGALCAISSIAGVRTHRYGGTYAASKAAIDMLIRTLADELGHAGVRANSVCPGLVETDLSQGLQDSSEVLNDYLACMPIARTGSVDDIGAAVRFLCGPEASWITGVNLSVDGGQHLRRGPDWSSFARMAFGDAAVDGPY